MVSFITPHENLCLLVEEACQKYADRVAYKCSDEQLTFEQIGQLSHQVAAGLRNNIKAQNGDRIAVMLPNVIEFPTITFGILRSKLIQVNTNPLYTSIELQHQMTNSGARCIFIHTMSVATLASIIESVDIDHVVIVGDIQSVDSDDIDNLLKHTKVEKFTDFLAQEMANNVSLPKVSQDDLAFLQYTGGTTNFAKGAMLSHANIAANVAQFITHTREQLLPGRETVITAIPVYHIFALTVNVIALFALGGTNVLITNPRDMDSFVTDWASSPISFATGVNTLFNGLVNTPAFNEIDFSSLKFVIGGGAPVQSVVSEKWKSITGQHLKEGYGLSETSPVLTMSPIEEAGFHSSIGVPMPDTKIVIRDDNGEDLPNGTEGELCASGPQVMKGYWQDAKATAEVMTSDRFFRTGDIAVVGDDGRLRIVDRKKDMILVSGFNVYPNEIEASVAGMDGVLECACIGRADDKTGEAVVLYVVRSDKNICEKSIKSFCRDSLTAYKIPSDIHFIDELPKSTVGKILRRELRSVN